VRQIVKIKLNVSTVFFKLRKILNVMFHKKNIREIMFEEIKNAFRKVTTCLYDFFFLAVHATYQMSYKKINWSSNILMLNILYTNRLHIGCVCIFLQVNRSYLLWAANIYSLQYLVSQIVLGLIHFVFNRTSKVGSCFYILICDYQIQFNFFTKPIHIS